MQPVGRYTNLINWFQFASGFIQRVEFTCKNVFDGKTASRFEEFLLASQFGGGGCIWERLTVYLWSVDIFVVAAEFL